MTDQILTPLSATFLLVLFAIAIGTAVINFSGAEVDTGDQVSQTSAMCDPSIVLKMKFVNNEITEQDYFNMKKVINEEKIE